MISSIKAGFCAGDQMSLTDDGPSAHISIHTDELLPVDVHEFHATAQARLTAGEHGVTLTGRAVRIRVPEGATCEFSCACADDAERRLSIKRVRLHFPKPLCLLNLLTSMSEVREFLAASTRSPEARADDRKDARKGAEDRKDARKGTETKSGDDFWKRAGAFLGKQAERLRKTEGYKAVGDFMGKIAETKGWKSIVAAAEKTSEKAAEVSPIVLEGAKDFFNILAERGEAALDRAVDVHITELVILGEADKEGTTLSLYATGEVVVVGARFPLRNWRVPRIFSTRFDARLQDLVAQFCVTTEQGTNISRTVLDIIDSVEGDISASFRLSPFALGIESRAQRTYNLGLSVDREGCLDAQFTVEIPKSDVALRLKGSIKNGVEETVTCSAQVDASIDALVACGAKLGGHSWTLSLLGRENDIRGSLSIDSGSRIYPSAVELTMHDPRLLHDLRLPLYFGAMPLEGTLSFGVGADDATVTIDTFALKTQGKPRWDTSIPLDLGPVRTEFERCVGDLAITATKDEGGRMKLDLRVEMDSRFDVTRAVQPIPEWRLLSTSTHTTCAGSLKATILGQMETVGVRSLECDFSGSSFDAELREFQSDRDAISVTSQGPVHIRAAFDKAALNADGLSETVAVLDWHCDESPTLRVDETQCGILADEMCTGHVRVRVSEQGIVRFEEGFGFYDAHFFHILFYPEHERLKMAALLEHKPFLEKIDEIVHVLRGVTGPVPSVILERIRAWWNRCRDRGIVIDIAHCANYHSLARMATAFLFEDESHLDEIEEIVAASFGGTGFDRYKLERLIDEAFPEFEMTQLAPFLRLFDLILRGLPYERPEERHDEALCDEYSHECRLLPSANQLFDLDTVPSDAFAKLYKYGGPCLIDTETTRNRIYKYAAGYTIPQIEWTLAHHGDLFRPEQKRGLEQLLAIKRRVSKQEPREGSFIVQDFNIDYFLQAILDREEDALARAADLTDCLDDFTERCTSDEVAECFATWLAPEDVGRLLAACIASRLMNQIVQLNQARILNYLVRRGRLYTLATFHEACAGSDRVLSGMLMSYLAEDQSLIRDPADRVDVLSRVTGIAFPRRSEYLAGGVHAGDSYCQRLLEVAHEINRAVEPYVAAKMRMQSDRIATESPILEETPRRPPYVPRYPDEDELAEITRAVEKADAAGAPAVQACREGREPDADDLERAAKAYRYAYRLAAAVLKKYPDAFQKDAFRRFYARTYEALMIQVLDGDLRADVDCVRRWFAVRSGIPADKVAGISMPRLRDAIIDVIYAREGDREARRNDPLTWVDIRPAARPVDLTILFAPGVITEGRQGHEIETAFERLRTRLGIRVVRADTGNIKPLRYNTSVLMDAIREIDSPFMIIGYSQGCANMMSAEAAMYASTPDDRARLDRLVARHFICSALNGSPHAVWGVQQYRQALVEGEMAIKSIAAVQSQAMSNQMFDGLRKLLDSPMFTMSLNSVESLSFQGLFALARDSQYTPGVISTEFQGLLREFVPEALQFVYYHILQCNPDLENDSQVTTDCAHGYHVFNRNDSVDLLRREAIPSCTIRAHHWSPLYNEVEFAETEKDIRDAVYRAPKDIHLMPPVEALMLFGKI